MRDLIALFVFCSALSFSQDSRPFSFTKEPIEGEVKYVRKELDDLQLQGSGSLRYATVVNGSLVVNNALFKGHTFICGDCTFRDTTFEKGLYVRSPCVQLDGCEAQDITIQAMSHRERKATKRLDLTRETRIHGLSTS